MRAKIDLIRIINDGKKDAVANFVVVTTMLDRKILLESYMLKPFNLELIKSKPFLRHLLHSFYPVWIGAMQFRVLRYGRVLDKDLFRAILNGKSIQLTGTVAYEN